MKFDNVDTFWDDVRKLVKRVTNDSSIKQWQRLADARYKELQAY